MSVIEEFISLLEIQSNLTVDKMLELVLAKARRLTVAEAGSIFIVRPTAVDSPNELLAMSLQNDKIEVESAAFKIPIDRTSIGGYVAATSEILEIEDLYNLDPSLPYSFNRSFDDRTGYKSNSMLSFPLKNFHGKVVGVVQLLNHINDSGNYEPFPLSAVDDMKSVITVLGVMIEQVDLLREIQDLREENDRLKR